MCLPLIDVSVGYFKELHRRANPVDVITGGSRE